MAQKSMNFVLEDETNDPTKRRPPVRGRVVNKNGMLLLYVDGYGSEHGMGPGESIGVVEMFDGQLQVILADDYKSEQTNTINMERARALTPKDWTPRSSGG